jgi:hypothetical protein
MMGIIRAMGGREEGLTQRHRERREEKRNPRTQAEACATGGGAFLWGMGWDKMVGEGVER